MSGNIAPWWERGWKAWWANQRTALHLEDPDGQFQYDAVRHEVYWRGHIAAVGRQWTLVIRWGPGTPFLPPWIYPEGIYSNCHQVRDGSMCLSPPTFTAVLGIGEWLAQARTWLNDYVRFNRAISSTDWFIGSLRRPDPGYRLHERPRSYLLTPPDWLPPTQHGELVALLPRTAGGLGILQRWRPQGQHHWRKFQYGTSALQLDGEEVSGFWFYDLHIGSTGSIRAFHERVLDGTQRSFIAFLDGPYNGLLQWELVQFDPIGGKAAAEDFVRMLRGEVASPSFGTAMSNLHWQRTIKGLPMHAAELTSRTRKSRSPINDAQVRNASVVLVGVGALGSEVAHLLAKEQVGRFLLIDGDLLMPGNVARHRLDLGAVGGNKAEKMRDYILRHYGAAQVEVVAAMLDEVLPTLTIPDDGLLIGITGDLASERVLSAIAQQKKMPCLHAWMECDGQVLRLLRSLPDRDPYLHELDELPPLPGQQTSPPPAECAEVVQPGAAGNLHAAANLVARVVVDVICERSNDDNHTLFAPDGFAGPGECIDPKLRNRYGHASCRLEKKR